LSRVPAIFLHDRHPRIAHCTAENLNTLGACISFDATTFAELPHKFDLTFDNYHTYWHCDVIWRDGDVGRVGVSWKTC